MKTKDDVEELEKLISQLESTHTEISQLAKKSPNDGVNLFKLKLINKILEKGNVILVDGYRPFEDFGQFDTDDLPTNSDVTMILSQYMVASERYRSDNVIRDGFGLWFYRIGEKMSDIPSKSATRIGIDKK